MSTKINVWMIVKNHLSTMTNSNGRREQADYWAFIILPLAASLLFTYRDWKLSSGAVGTLVNFGAIFSALLISVLVMVYDLHQKQEDRKAALHGNGDVSRRQKIELRILVIRQMYHNISYCILTSLLLVVCALCYQFAGTHWTARFIFLPLNIFFTGSLLLTTLMVLKRTYMLITTTD